ncbi:HNH endonuclease signature motif containing protein [Paenibacillus odorifer]|uniref:HNH endonuclease signature motif containing protein n=1 Tax=Paenibacillus odorifer TaxID=189426 RepID=UPI00096D48B5|nr:HNH endonuclease signature motif containing protein [Paenibacillus odorifer]OMD16236.1 hypothetical protein BJP50_18535 [Paenibacillus odorifer]
MPKVVTKVEVKCEVCGKREMKNPSDAGRYRTCSKACLGRLSSYRYSRKVSKACEVCGDLFEVKPSHYEVRFTCSEACKYVRLGPRLKTLNLSGHDSVNWKGGRTVTPAGYVLVYAPGNPMSNVRGYVREHRLVMSEHLGRTLTGDEVVHHLDGDKANNVLDNLQLLTNAEHSAIHAKEREYIRDASGRIIRRAAAVEVSAG